MPLKGDIRRMHPHGHHGSIPDLTETPAARPRRTFLKLCALGLLGTLGCASAWHRRRWGAIIIHHSAGDFGNVTFLDKVHRQRQPYDPIDSMAYHFVIGNGNGMALGAVDQGWRWRKRLWGSHVSAGNTRFNFRGIGICLIGNYHLGPVPREQYRTLVRLVRDLRSAHRIRASDVIPHCRLEGERTVCPGKHFPYERFWLDIA